jgi:hypothetical protein
MGRSFRILAETILAVMLVTLGTRSASCQASPADENPLSPLVVSMVPQQAIAPVLGSDDRYHLLYELQLTNTLGGPADLRSVTVLDAENGKTLLTLNAAEIIKAITCTHSTASSPRAHRSRRSRGAF